jgi:hypothetical protein
MVTAKLPQISVSNKLWRENGIFSLVGKASGEAMIAILNESR